MPVMGPGSAFFLCFLRSGLNKSYRFIGQKHVFYPIKAMLLSDKSIALIFGENIAIS